MKEDISKYLNINLNNKFYLKIVFEINNEKISDCMNIIKNIKMEGIEFTLPTKSILDENNCTLTISTKVGTRVQDITLQKIKDFTDSIKELKSVSEIVWVVYDNDDNKIYRYEYNSKLNIEDFEA